jgi:hypothetical protein
VTHDIVVALAVLGVAGQVLGPVGRAEAAPDDEIGSRGDGRGASSSCARTAMPEPAPQ